MTRPVSKSARRAMTDALRHMHQSGVRVTDIRHGSGTSTWTVWKSLDRIVLPGRDGISGAASPRHIHSSIAGDVVPPNLAGRNGNDAPVAPAPFPGGLQSLDGGEQSCTGLEHSAVVTQDLQARHGAEQGRSVP